MRSRCGSGKIRELLQLNAHKNHAFEDEPLKKIDGKLQKSSDHEEQVTSGVLVLADYDEIEGN